MRTFEVTVREVTLSLSPDAARNRLERAIAVTDIERSDSPLTGTLEVWGMACRYEWTVEPTAEGARVRESFAVNGLGFLALAGFLPAIFLLSLGLLVVASDAVPLVYTRPDGTVANWPGRLVLMLGVVIAGLSTAYFYRVSEVPSPVADQFAGDVTDRRMEHAVVGVALLMAPLLVPMVAFLGLILLTDISPISASVVRGLGGSTLVMSAVGTAVVGRAYLSNDASWLRRSPGPLRQLEHHEADPVPYRVVEARYGGGSGSIPLSVMERRLSKAADAVGINIDPELVDNEGNCEVMSGKTDWHGIDVTYEWEIITEGALGEQEHTVRETLLLDNDFTTVVSGLALSAAVVIVALQFGWIFDPLSNAPGLFRFMLVVAFVMIAIGTYVLLYLPKVVFPYGLEVVTDDGQIETQRLAVNRYVLAFMTLFAVGALWPAELSSAVPALAVAGLVAGSLLAVGSYRRFAGHHKDLPTAFDVPPPMNDYLGAFGLLLVTPAVLAVAEWNTVLTAFLLPLTLLTGGTIVWVVANSRADREIRTALFQSRDVGSGGGTFSRAVGYSLAALLSVGVVVVPLWVAVDIVTMGESVMRFPMAGVFVAVSAIPVCGVAYQVGKSASELRRTLGQSRPVDPGAFDLPPDLIDAELRVYDGPAGGARGFSFGFRDIVLFSTGDAAALETEELAALLAHEDAHASEYADGLISVSAPLVAGLTATGQNVLFAALRFDRREIRADEYAADRVSPEAIAGAIRTVRDVQVTNRAGGTASRDRAAAAAFSSFAPHEDDLSWSDETFGLFFGPYTMTRAHPTVEARLDRLDALAAADREAESAVTDAAG